MPIPLLLSPPFGRSDTRPGPGISLSSCLRATSALRGDGVGYLWLPALGGRRKLQPGSLNGAWGKRRFQGYADHMASQEFGEGLDKALALATHARTALMCAEAPWWRCHRRLISDLLTHRGHTVLHIIGSGEAKPHPLSTMARANGRDLIYPPPQAELFLGTGR